MPQKISSSVIKRLQIIFFISMLLLLSSSVLSYYSLRKMMESSGWINHTYRVLAEAEHLISTVKDAEIAQRGYLISHNPDFLKPYAAARERSAESFRNMQELTSDNPRQQESLKNIKSIMDERYLRLQELLSIDSAGAFLREDPGNRQLLQGKMLMDGLRRAVDEIKATENALLEKRTREHNKFILYTPILILSVALLSVLITAFSYFRIKKDMNAQLAKQKAEAETYRETSRRIVSIEKITRQISAGEYAVHSDDNKEDELGRISYALKEMAAALEKNFSELERKNWLQEGTVKIGNAIRGKRNIKELADAVLRTITEYTGVPVGSLYLAGENGNLELSASYANTAAPESIKKGEGILGQAVKDRKTLLISELPATYHRQISSASGATAPACVLAVPFLYNNEALGAIELFFLKKPSEAETELLEKNKEAIAIGIHAALNFKRMQELLEETQAQAEELGSQHSELETQAHKLQASEEELRVQQEELRQTNEELEERSALLRERNSEIRKKVKELEQSTQYKSEFMANMSHELRTPLNSILLLSRLLAENNEKNLKPEQTEYARVIHHSGNGLLSLIDEILDLSKIEAGKMDLDYRPVAVSEIVYDMKSLFAPLASEKNIEFHISVHPEAPENIRTDKARLEQVLKNLLSNAVKFTEKGGVAFEIKRHPENKTVLCLAVKDSGIGIPEDKQEIIFEAFRQADGSTRRRFGGTGLGLSISRELIKLLNGEILLKSIVNEGSEFTVHLPLERVPEQKEPRDTLFSEETATDDRKKAAEKGKGKFITPVIPKGIADDREKITKKNTAILIVEDDIDFARSLLDFTRERGYCGLVSVRGDEALPLAKKYLPAGILLDIELPVKNGWEVMDELKNDPATRHIPVHIMSAHKVKKESLLKGAVDFIDKPVAYEKMQEIFKRIEFVISRSPKKVLIIEDNNRHARALAYFLESKNIRSEIKSDIAESIRSLKKKEAECVILDMGIPDTRSYSLLKEIKQHPDLEKLPVIIFTGKNLSPAEEQQIGRYADSIVVKTAHSYQRMHDEVSLFLHQVEESGIHSKNSRPNALTEILNNKTALIVDDDVRNIFSLSKALENMKMNIITALDGKEAIKKLQENPRTDIVLLDMMMPELDGYETASKIRESAEWKHLPVIAVTAKAMAGDREKCILAGASDYITKPVDTDQLLSLLRVWLY